LRRRLRCRAGRGGRGGRAVARGRSAIRLLVLSCLALTAPLIGAAAALAAPINDDFASASLVSALPFGDTVDASSATTEPGEPQSCFFSSQTVWYTFIPQDATLGKVTFQAVATILTARDAQPADNTAIAPPTTVTA
jgi:hypothetical protein